MSNANFKENYARLLKKAGDKAELVVRKTAIELQSMMIERSPVDTGRFRSSWQAGIGSINTAISATAESDALGRSAMVLTGWKLGQTIFLSNSMPYSKRLEFGWSKQAPAPNGIVRLTVQNYSAAIARAVAELK